VSEQIIPPPDSVDALSDNTLQDELNDLIRRRIERETASLRTVIMRLQQSRSRLEEQHSARETHLLSQLDVAQKHVARLQAVPFPLNLMHCNKCGEPFSDNEAIHVADNCGAVGRLGAGHESLLILIFSFFARTVERIRHTSALPMSHPTHSPLTDSSRLDAWSKKRRAPVPRRPISTTWAVVRLNIFAYIVHILISARASHLPELPDQHHEGSPTKAKCTSDCEVGVQVPCWMQYGDCVHCGHVHAATRA
jgi:hypothetical protein